MQAVTVAWSARVGALEAALDAPGDDEDDGARLVAAVVGLAAAGRAGGGGGGGGDDGGGGVTLVGGSAYGGLVAALLARCTAPDVYVFLGDRGRDALGVLVVGGCLVRPWEGCAAAGCRGGGGVARVCLLCGGARVLCMRATCVVARDSCVFSMTVCGLAYARFMMGGPPLRQVRARGGRAAGGGGGGSGRARGARRAERRFQRLPGR
jgi:hypothetical protein